MELLVLEKVKENIENEIIKNGELIEELKYKLKILEDNSLKKRLDRIESVAVISWIVFILVLVFNVNKILIPVELISGLTLGVPVLIGYTVERIVAKKLGIIDNLKSVTNARKNSEIKREMVSLSIKKKQLVKETFILYNIYTNINDDEKNLMKVFDFSIRDLKEDVKYRDIFLDKKEKELNKLIIKDYMVNYFADFRDNFSGRLMDLFTKSLSIGPLLGLLFHFPIILMIKSNPLLSVGSVYSVILPYFVGIMGTLVVLTKKIVDEKVLFEKINKEYLQNEMSYFCEECEKEVYTKELEKVIKEIIEFKTKLVCEKEILELSKLVDNNIENDNVKYCYSLEKAMNIDDCFYCKNNEVNSIEKNYVKKRIKD